jgi:hypothetical protein
MDDRTTEVIRELDLEKMAERNRMTADEMQFMLQAAELSGKAFSRVDPTTRTTRWYWRG